MSDLIIAGKKKQEHTHHSGLDTPTIDKHKQQDNSQ